MKLDGFSLFISACTRGLISHWIGPLQRLSIGLAGMLVVQGALADNVLPQPEPAFKGKIGLTAKESVPDWPPSVKAPQDAPNIVVILLDDIGFADTSSFGGVAQTPELSKMAEHGLRFNNFNTTGMCSPTRAALLTGRNHHRVGFGIIADWAGGFPGYNSVWKKSTASIAEILRQNGYSTSAFGKWHNTPNWEITPVGPFDRWPAGLGFEYFYGFMGPSGGENHWDPIRLYRNTVPVDPPATPEEGYHLTTDITDEAIRWVQTHASLAPDKPYFLYLAPGAVHLPHHVPKEWIEKYRGRFDRGWDQLNQEVFARQKQLGVIPAQARRTPRPKEIPAWSSLSRDQQKLYARQMEVYAAFIAHTDAEIGRLLKTVRSRPRGDNTLVLYIVGDNGASGISGLDGFASGATTVQDQLQRMDELGSPEIPSNMSSMGWNWLGNAPFQWWKMFASHFGGVRAPLVVSWPSRIKPSGVIRSQFIHVNDVAATLYEVAGIAFPTEVNGVVQQPLDGVSFAHTFSDANAPSAHRTQYFEIIGNRAIYHDGWVAVAKHLPAADWFPIKETDYALDRWELYHVAEDFSQARDLAGRHPDKLKELQALFDVEARKNDVYPLGAAFGAGKPSLTAGRREFTYYPATQRIPAAALPRFTQSSHRLIADVFIPDTGAEGVIASYGDRLNNFTLYVKDNHLIYENRRGSHRDTLVSQTVVPRGNVEFVFEFTSDGSPIEPSRTRQGTGRLYIHGQLTGEAKLALTLLGVDTALFVGKAVVPPTRETSMPPFASKFTGTLNHVKIELK